MVSLGDGSNGGRQEGGFFFNEREPSILQAPEDEELLITQNLQIEDEPHYKQCDTVWVTVCQMILIIVYLASSIVLPYGIEPKLSRNSTEVQLEVSFTYIAFSHPCVWLVLLVADRYLQYKHTLLRRHGYLDFTQKTRYLRRTAEFMFALGNAAMLIVIMLRYTIMAQMNVIRPVGTVSIHGVNYQEMIIGIESIIALFCCGRYTMLVYKFNQAKLPPDAEHEEQMIAVMQPSTHLPDIGYRDSQYVDALLERQADMIRYLKHHTEYLSKRILKLRAVQNDGRIMGSLQV